MSHCRTPAEDMAMPQIRQDLLRLIRDGGHQLSISIGGDVGAWLQYHCYLVSSALGLPNIRRGHDMLTVAS